MVKLCCELLVPSLHPKYFQIRLVGTRMYHVLWKTKKETLKEKTVPIVVIRSSLGLHSKSPLSLYNLTFPKVDSRCRYTLLTLVTLTFANVEANKIFFRTKCPSVVS